MNEHLNQIESDHEGKMRQEDLEVMKCVEPLEPEIPFEQTDQLAGSGDWLIREFLPMDYPAARALWLTSEGVGQGPGDSENGVKLFLARNPGLSCVAVSGQTLVAAILSGHDGRRGFIYHLAVAQTFRRQGLASALVLRCLSGLQAAGIERCQIFVLTDNAPAHDFWQRIGGRLRTDLCVYSIPLSP
jgi:GNAT superfamily N-acetyltransferase